MFQAAFKAANAVLADESLSEDDQAVVHNAVSELNALEKTFNSGTAVTNIIKIANI